VQLRASARLGRAFRIAKGSGLGDKSGMFATGQPASVVTGGAGFLGSHLIDRLLAEGHRVTAIDNLVTGNPRNLLHHSGNPNFCFIRQDVTRFLNLPQEIDYIFHLASPASPIALSKLAIATLKAGALGTHNALGLAKARDATFVLASTSECYGDPLVHPQTEEYCGNVNPIGQRSAYTQAKRFAEAITMAYHRYHEVDTRIARIFNTYGPRMSSSDGRVVPAFLGQALGGMPLTIFGDGSQTRSFCYVSDLIDGIFQLALSDFHEPVNIGGQQEITIKRLADEIIRLTGSTSRIEYKARLIDDPRMRQPDITRAHQILGWEPRVPLEEGISRTIEYFLAH
jgi:dTDP-glucose 4,6-dehydratase